MVDLDLFAERLGNLLREARGNRRQLDVADAVGISDSTYSDYERGNVVPSFRILIDLLNELGIEHLAFFGALFAEPAPEPNGNEVAA